MTSREAVCADEIVYAWKRFCFGQDKETHLSALNYWTDLYVDSRDTNWPEFFKIDPYEGLYNEEGELLNA